jgi:RNase H-fold protein (predicted Holliday junction resolvase)
MDNSKIIEILAYTLPSLITGGVAYFLFNSYFKDQQNMRRWLLQKENQKDSLPLRLQAYERMALFLERINPSNLLIRVTPFSSDKNQYESLIIEHINQEYEHNITQQIYVTDECWTIIMTAKNTTIQNIRKTNMNEKVDSANKLRETILSDLLDNQSPSTLALAFLKDEVGRII